MLFQNPDDNNVISRVAMNETGFIFFGVITKVVSEYEAEVQILYCHPSLPLFRELEHLNIYFTNIPPGQSVSDLAGQELEITLHSLPQPGEGPVKGFYRNIESVERSIAEDIEIVSRKHLEVFAERLSEPKSVTENEISFESQVTLLHDDEFINDSAQVQLNILDNSGYVKLTNCPKFHRLGLPTSFATKWQRMSMDMEGVLIILGQSEHLGDYVVWITPHES